MGLISRVSSRTYRYSHKKPKKPVMSTAHRPTWTPATAGDKRAESDLGKLSLQWSSRDAPSQTKSKADLKRQLEEKEATQARKALKDAPENAGLDDEEIEKKRLKFEKLDKDDPVDSSSSEEEDSDEHLAELAKIKKERAEEEARRQAEQAEQN